MSRLRVAAGVAALIGLASSVGCSEAEIVAELRSLQGSEDVVFVCRDATGAGRPLSECPDRDFNDDADPRRALSLYALVSQTVTDEVAVVNLSAGRVIDVEPNVPGFGFLRVGGRPVAMAATPGGAATFVATAELGRNGIFALPSSCLNAPTQGEPPRDLTTWPACRLDSAPGEIAVLVEPAEETCSGAPAGEPGEQRSHCWVDLEEESAPAGRRKLVVSLPDRGELVVIDAQAVLNTDAGAFPDCEIEARLALDVDIPSDVTQTLPPDLQTECVEVPPPAPPQPGRRAPRPAGFAVADDRLYVADQAAPVIHVLDTTSVCNMTQLPSLLPMSLREPERVVTTRRVAASPLTPSGKRYVYAIDAEDQPGASVMAFDVSPGVSDRTPIVRPGSPELPGERPDRLSLGSSARDVTFAYRDLPYVDPLTGVGEFGTLCDPSPQVSKDSPAGLARPSSDFSSGARPGLLRGLFGFILLTNGNVAVIDVEDFDAPCRRPVQANASEAVDIRGCAGDPPDVSFFTEDGEAGGPRTVTGEVSCLVVEPHRFRGATLAVNDPEVGVRAPSLRGFPQLTLPSSAASSDVADRPRLLGVPYADAPAEVFVGSTRYASDGSSEDPLPVDPNSRASEQLQALNAVVLPPRQPRAYAAQDTVTLVYEGSYAGERTAGFLRPGGVLVDASLSFCAAGVYDEAAMADYGVSQLGLTDEQAAAFAEQHADYLQLTTALVGSDNAYWREPGNDYDACLSAFGAHDAEVLLTTRDFRVTQAFADRLVLAPREAGVDTELLRRCFPTANQYRLRAGRHWVLTHAATGFNHDIVASGDTRACVRSCSPLKKWAKGRVFEISSDRANCRDVGADGDPLDLRVGCAREDEVACVYEQPAPGAGEDGGVPLTGRGSECIFDGLTERFALYRGRLPSERDFTFTWQTAGGFSPLMMSLANVSTVVLPQSIQFVPQTEHMAVVDGSSLGLSLLSLDTFGVVRPSPFY